MRRDEHGRHRASYTWHIDGDVLVIVDLDQGRSVTNDADLVIQDLVTAGISVDRYAILYLDTMKRYDGLATRDGRFAGFIPIGEADYAEAREQLLRRRAEGQGRARIAGEILPTLGGDTAAIVGETLRDVLDLSTWTETHSQVPSLTPEQEAERRLRREEWERTRHGTPPKRVH